MLSLLVEHDSVGCRLRNRLLVAALLCLCGASWGQLGPHTVHEPFTRKRQSRRGGSVDESWTDKQRTVTKYRDYLFVSVVGVEELWPIELTLVPPRPETLGQLDTFWRVFCYTVVDMFDMLVYYIM